MARQPLAEEMVAGIRRFCRAELMTAPATRSRRWDDLFPQASDSAEVASQKKRSLRQQLAKWAGVVDRRVTADPTQKHQFRFPARPTQPTHLARTDNCVVHHVSWPVIDGITAEGLMISPLRPRAAVVVIPDATWTPEQFAGIESGVPASAQLPRRLAESGCLVIVPLLINRDDEFSGHKAVRFTNQPHREFIYRQAFEMGRHVVGYEVQKVLAAIDLLGRQRTQSGRPLPVGVVGVGEGGLMALLVSALDERVQSALICGYFDQRESVWQQPISRNIWRLLTVFGDAELAAMASARRFVIEPCRVPLVDGPPPMRPGRPATAAPGRVIPQSRASVKQEMSRLEALAARRKSGSRFVLAGDDRSADRPAGSRSAVVPFLDGLGISDAPLKDPPPWRMGPKSNRLSPSQLTARQQQQFDELQEHVQGLMRSSARVRDHLWHSDAGSFAAVAGEWEKRRARVYDELIGRLPHRRLPPRPRSRLLLDRPRYRAFEIKLEVFRDIFASGILLLPKDLREGERRPVVVCQHGLESLAMDTISREPRAFRFYKAFAEELCLRGFIVYSPQNPYRGRDAFRVIQRMSNPLGRSLFSYIIPQHEQTVAWLGSLPQVDPQRIGFYGLSYGGKTAMRVPPFVSGYCLNICSGDYTRWIRSIAGNDTRYNYIFTSEYEIPEWNMGHVAGYAELAMLMAPRPFMVEQGLKDGGAPPEWVEQEFQRFRRFYDRIGIGDRTEIEFFDGPHTIHGVGTFRFLHKHLNWPMRQGR